jgi:hypothetical protein
MATGREMVGIRSSKLDYSINKTMTQAQQIRYLQLFNHVVSLGGLIFAVVSNQLWLIYLSIAVGLFFGVIGINIGFHRYLTHKSFETYPELKNSILISICQWNIPNDIKSKLSTLMSLDPSEKIQASIDLHQTISIDKHIDLIRKG